MALAHRGGSLYAPNLGLENTMTAFGNAVDLGYTHLETDVHVTRDGRLVAFHDTGLDRVSNARGRIRDLPWSEVAHARGRRRRARAPAHRGARRLARHQPQHRPQGPRHGRAAVAHHRGARACTTRCASARSPQRNISQFRRLLARHGRHRGRRRSARPLARFGPRALTAVAAAPPPTSSRSRHRSRARAGRSASSPSDSSRRAHRYGKQVHVWTIDDADEMHRLLDLGVDGLVSDRIDVLKDVLVERGAWTGRD